MLYCLVRFSIFRVCFAFLTENQRIHTQFHLKKIWRYTRSPFFYFDVRICSIQWAFLSFAV